MKETALASFNLARGMLGQDLDIGCVCVCLSATRWHWLKTNDRIGSFGFHHRVPKDSSFLYQLSYPM